MMQNNITLSDIAEKLGVSSVTVSKALSGKKGVSDELREKIESLADEMGYVRKDKNDVARKSKVIGVIVAERYLDHSQSFYWRIYQKLSLISNEKKIFTLLEVISKTAETEKNVPNLVRQDNVDGIIILGAFDVGYLRMLKEIVDVPLVSLDSVYEEIAGDAVIADNILGGYEIAGYLLKMGHKKIGFVGTMNVTPSIDERYIGMCKQLSASGISVEYGKNPIVVADRDADGNIGAEGTFKLPDKNIRKEIWQGAFGSDVPLSDDIDFEYLAETFEFSGGEIKNAVLNAVFYGAADGGVVGMKHVMKAVYRELTKLRTVTLTGNYGKYAYMLQD